MKMLALLVSFAAFNAFGANIRLEMTFESFDTSDLRKAYVVFESTSTLCQKVSVGLGGIGAVNRTRTYPLSIDKVDANTIALVAPKKDPNDDKCLYKFSRMVLNVNNLVWISLASTRNQTYEARDGAVNIVRNPQTRIEADCRVDRCRLRANGTQIGFSTNAVEIFADKEVFERNSDTKGKMKVSVAE